jgi:hypothetical protein
MGAMKPDYLIYVRLLTHTTRKFAICWYFDSNYDFLCLSFCLVFLYVYVYLRSDPYFHFMESNTLYNTCILHHSKHQSQRIMLANTPYDS